MRRRLAFLLVLAICAIACTPTAASAAPRAFSVRFTANDTGDVTGTANTLMTCPLSASQCDAARAGTASRPVLNNNNSYDMVYVNEDTAGAPVGVTVFNSSTANLLLPGGATVLTRRCISAPIRPRAPAAPLRPTPPRATRSSSRRRGGATSASPPRSSTSWARTTGTTSRASSTSPTSSPGRPGHVLGGQRAGRHRAVTATPAGRSASPIATLRSHRATSRSSTDSRS